eukprot:scaffold7419_cov31-Tisochrysis_lutea.AAC.5
MERHVPYVRRRHDARHHHHSSSPSRRVPSKLSSLAHTQTLIEADQPVDHDSTRRAVVAREQQHLTFVHRKSGQAGRRGNAQAQGTRKKEKERKARKTKRTKKTVNSARGRLQSTGTGIADCKGKAENTREWGRKGPAGLRGGASGGRGGSRGNMGCSWRGLGGRCACAWRSGRILRAERQ